LEYEESNQFSSFQGRIQEFVQEGCSHFFSGGCYALPGHKNPLGVIDFTDSRRDEPPKEKEKKIQKNQF